MIGPVLTFLLSAAASAHGPAPVGLEVVTVDQGDGCPTVPTGTTPELIRTNIGLARHDGDGTYTYACPARWAEAEQALVAALPDGAILVASSRGVFFGTDHGCDPVPVSMDVGDVPVDVLAWQGDLLLLTRRFDDGSSALWSVDGPTPTRLHRWDDQGPDGLTSADDGVWIAGARPEVFLDRWDGETMASWTPDWPEAVDTLDRLTPRLAHDGGVWLAAGSGLQRTLWWTDGTEVVVGPGPAERSHGPVPLGEGLVALLDGEVWADHGGAWVGTGTEVDWTCLHTAAGNSYACGLTAMRVLEGSTPDDLVGTPVFGLEQLGPPDPACAGVDGACELDWLHFGGESDLVETMAVSCPGEVRPPRPEGDDEPPPVSGPSSSCAHGTAPGALAWTLALLALGRRRSG